MKSIKYFAIAYLIAGALSMQAMNKQVASTGKKRSQTDEQPSPFSVMSSEMQRQIANQFEQAECDLTRLVGNAYDSDMQKLIASLDSTSQDAAIQFPQANCHKIGNTVYFVDQKYVTPANFPPYYVDDPEALKKIIPQHSYQREEGLGNRPQHVTTLSAQMGRLADILLARALLAASSRDKGGTPDDIRAELSLNYTEYSKANRRYLFDNSPTPISSETIKQELKALNEIKFNCTPENITLSVIEKLSPFLYSSSTFIDQIPNYRDYLLQKACAQYCKPKAKALVQEQYAKYLKTFGNGV